MKKAVVFISGFIFGLSVLTGIAHAADKFAYVDLGRSFSEYNKTKDYDKVLGAKGDVYTSDMQKKESEVKSFKDKFDLLSDKEKEAKKSELDTKMKTLEDYSRQKQTDLRKEQDEKMKEILKDIEGTIKQYSEKEGYSGQE